MRKLLLTLTLFLATTAPAAAQQRAGVMGELTADIHSAHQKFVALARAMPVDKQDWRPGPGVRSVREVFLHVASDNYWLPTTAGIAAPASTGITGKGFEGVEAFEKQNLTREQVADAVDASFNHLHKALAETTDAKLEDKVKLFGREMTLRGLWIATATHMHEHLGQAIAYARSNNVVPPWSK